jgi:hypothetical protein
MLTGVLRYAGSNLLLRLAQGWKLTPTDLGPTHGEWSVLIWWCDGSCKEGEAP